MRAHRWHAHRRGGVVLDLILGVGLVLVGAFALGLLGLNFGEILEGAKRFFGV